MPCHMATQFHTFCVDIMKQHRATALMWHKNPTAPSLHLLSFLQSKLHETFIFCRPNAHMHTIG